MTNQETNYKPGWVNAMGDPEQIDENDMLAQSIAGEMKGRPLHEIDAAIEKAKREKETSELMTEKKPPKEKTLALGMMANPPAQTVKTGLPQDDQLREVLQTWEKKGSDRAAEIRAKIEEKTRLFKAELAKMEADLAAAENTVSMARNGMAYTPPIVDHDAGTDGKDVDG